MLPFVNQLRRAHLHKLSKQFFNESPVVDPATPQFVVGTANGFLPREVSYQVLFFTTNLY